LHQGHGGVIIAGTGTGRETSAHEVAGPDPDHGTSLVDPAADKTDGYIILNKYPGYMEATACEHENSYMLLFMLGAIILVFSLYLNVYFLYKTSFMP